MNFFNRKLFVPDDARIKFKKYVNVIATTKTEGNEKFLILKPKYSSNLDEINNSFQRSPQHDPRNSIGIPVNDFSPYSSPVHRQPPPYRPPPPVTSPSPSLDNISISSSNISLSEGYLTPQVPPRRKSIDKDTKPPVFNIKTPDKNLNDEKENEAIDNSEKQTISVKERTQKFNRLASVEEDLSPRQIKDKKKTHDKKVFVYNFLLINLV